MLKHMFACVCLFVAMMTAAAAQSQLDPDPYDPASEPNVDMFISDWRHSTPRHVNGSLILRDILTPLTSGDPLAPDAPGAVLCYLKTFAYGTLAPHARTMPVTLDGEQQVFFVVGGTGKISTAGTESDLFDGVHVLIPEGVEYTLTNTCEDELVIVLMTEPTYDGFEPIDDILVRNVNTMPIHYSSGHWSNIHTNVFGPADGLATISGMGPVRYSPGTICQPHTHGEGAEEVWVALDGTTQLLLGKQLRELTPGMGFKNPPSGTHPYGPINPGDTTVKLFYVGASSH